jgi:hypothetical protein
MDRAADNSTRRIGDEPQNRQRVTLLPTD